MTSQWAHGTTVKVHSIASSTVYTAGLVWALQTGLHASEEFVEEQGNVAVGSIVIPSLNTRSVCKHDPFCMMKSLERKKKKNFGSKWKFHGPVLPQLPGLALPFHVPTPMVTFFFFWSTSSILPLYTRTQTHTHAHNDPQSQTKWMKHQSLQPLLSTKVVDSILYCAVLKHTRV